MHRKGMKQTVKTMQTTLHHNQRRNIPVKLENPISQNLMAGLNWIEGSTSDFLKESEKEF
jgi:hypothetical protein